HGELHRRPAVPQRGGRRRGVRQRQHPLYRWRPVWPGGEDWHLHPEAQRPGPHGAGTAGEHKVPQPGQRPGAMQHSSKNSRANSSSWFFSSPLSRSSSAKIMVRSLSWKKASSRPGSPLGAGAGAGGGEGSGGGGSCRGGSLGGFLGGGM